MSPAMGYLAQRFHVSAAHWLWAPHLSVLENEKTFGKHTRVHGHNYTFKIVVKGPIDKRSGIVMNVTVLKSIVQEMVLNPLDHRNISDLPYFSDKPSTMENLAVFVWEEVKKGMVKGGISPDILHEVEVYATKNVSLSYRGEEN